MILSRNDVYDCTVQYVKCKMYGDALLCCCCLWCCQCFTHCSYVFMLCTYHIISYCVELQYTHTYMQVWLLSPRRMSVNCVNCASVSASDYQSRCIFTLFCHRKTLVLILVCTDNDWCWAMCEYVTSWHIWCIDEVVIVIVIVIVVVMMMMMLL